MTEKTYRSVVRNGIARKELVSDGNRDKRMKKVAPEVRMTEAARKRSAKIRQDKETAENKPVSPRLHKSVTQFPRLRATSEKLERGKPLMEKKHISNVNRNGMIASSVSAPPKKPKIDCSSSRSRTARLSKCIDSAIIVNPLGDRNHRPKITSVQIEKPKKMSSVTVAKVREKEEKEALRNQIAILEEDKEKLEKFNINLEEELKQKNDEIEKLNIISSVILPNIYKQNQNLVEQNQENVQKACVELAKVTKQFALQELELENKLKAAEKNIIDMEFEIHSKAAEIEQLHVGNHNLNGSLREAGLRIESLEQDIVDMQAQHMIDVQETVQAELVKVTKEFAIQELEMENKLDNAARIIKERNSRIIAIKQQMVDMKAQNDKIIEETVQERIKPWINSKAEADSCGIEIELKNRMMGDLRADLNKKKKEYEEIYVERENLLKRTQNVEEKEAKIECIQKENADLRCQLEVSRGQLQSKEMELQDLSFSLDEEKYRNSLPGSERVNTSFRAVYEESNSAEEEMSDDVFK